MIYHGIDLMKEFLLKKSKNESSPENPNDAISNNIYLSEHFTKSCSIKFLLISRLKFLAIIKLLPYYYLLF